MEKVVNINLKAFLVFSAFLFLLLQIVVAFWYSSRPFVFRSKNLRVSVVYENQTLFGQEKSLGLSIHIFARSPVISALFSLPILSSAVIPSAIASIPLV